MRRNNRFEIDLNPILRSVPLTAQVEPLVSGQASLLIIETRFCVSFASLRYLHCDASGIRSSKYPRTSISAALAHFHPANLCLKVWSCSHALERRCRAGIPASRAEMGLRRRVEYTHISYILLLPLYLLQGHVERYDSFIHGSTEKKRLSSFILYLNSVGIPIQTHRSLLKNAISCPRQRVQHLQSPFGGGDGSKLLIEATTTTIMRKDARRHPRLEHVVERLYRLCPLLGFHGAGAIWPY